MLRPYAGMGNKSKAEALFLRKDRKPKYRGYFSFEGNDDYSSPRYKQWMIDQWGKYGSKLTMEECIEFLGEPLREEDARRAFENERSEFSSWNIRANKFLLAFQKQRFFKPSCLRQQ